MKNQRSTAQQIRKLGYRWSNKNLGWVKVSAEYIQLEHAAMEEFWVRYEEYKLDDWLWHKANPNSIDQEVGQLALDEISDLYKDRPKCPDIEFDLDPDDYQELTA
jgi:hypothetical protein